MPAIDKILRSMIDLGASDFHLSSSTQPRFRLHGEMHPIEGMKEAPSEVIRQLLEEIVPEKNKTEFAERNDTDFAYEVPGLARFRVNMFMDNKGLGAVLRQIPAKILSVEDLKLPPIVKRFCEL